MVRLGRGKLISQEWRVRRIFFFFFFRLRAGREVSSQRQNEKTEEPGSVGAQC